MNSNKLLKKGLSEKEAQEMVKNANDIADRMKKMRRNKLIGDLITIGFYITIAYIAITNTILLLK